MAILKSDDIFNHEVDTSDLIVSECYIERTSTIRIFVEDWELAAKVLYVFIIVE